MASNRRSRSADVAHDLADVYEVAPMEPRGMNHVRVPVLPSLPQAPEHDVVAVEACVVRTPDDGPGGDGRERRAAAPGDVEALVPAPAVAGGVELPHRAPGPVGSANREEVAMQLDAAGLLLVSPRHRDDDAVGPVGDGPAAVGEPVPLHGLVGAGLQPGTSIRRTSSPRAGDPDRDIGGRRATELELDADAVDRVREPRSGETEALWTTASSAAVSGAATNKEDSNRTENWLRHQSRLQAAAPHKSLRASPLMRGRATARPV